MSRGADFNKPGLKFRKGFNILFKILLSFDSAALYILWLKFLQVLFLPFDLIFWIVEKLTIKKYENKDIPIIFVVGIQRTGSTLVSQFIEKTFPFFPVGNFNSIFKRSKFYIHKCLSNLYKKPNQSYQNFYGIAKGFYSIGDCYELWDRWFGKNHYILPTDLNTELQYNLISYFTFLYRAYGKPILTKNNRNSLLIPFFNRAFNNSFFVIVKRDPVAVVRSTIKASKDFFGSSDLLWGLYPNDDFETENYENIIEAATVQFLMLDKLLGDQIKQVNEESYLVINYDEFCTNPRKFQEDLRDKLKGKRYNLEKIIYRDKAFKTSKRLKHLEIDDQINNYINKWKDKI